MKWRKKADSRVLHDAWMTLHTYFKPVKEKKFMAAAKKGVYKRMTIASVLANPPVNVSVRRLKAKTARQAYPKNSRPRGEMDIESVEYFKNTNQAVSPIVFWKDKKLTLLDGMHRLTAVALRKDKSFSALIIKG